jgi:hypothetical protein
VELAGEHLLLVQLGFELVNEPLLTRDGHIAGAIDTANCETVRGGGRVDEANQLSGAILGQTD